VYQGEGLRPTAASPDPDADRERSLRRTRGRLRRYSSANRFDRLVTLTNRDVCLDFDVFTRRLAAFERRLRQRHPEMPWAFSYELHPEGHGWHAHGGLPWWVAHAELAALWGHGFVHIRRFKGRTGTRPGLDAARQVGRYIAKYAGKDNEAIPPGRQRYRVRHGYQPEAVRVYLGHPEDVPGALAWLLEDEPSYRWSSSGSPEWTGPPAWFVST
jgi:hypothetical protein